MCDTRITVTITPSQLFAYNQGAYAQDVLSDYDNDVREQFISGTCAPCWDSMFSLDENEEYIDYYAESSLFGDC
jgi:hypothetical protein